MLRMILRVLLLISFTCCVCGTLVVNVTQSSYQAEENQNITLEWMFTTEADTSPNAIFIYCHMIIDSMATVLFHLIGGVEDQESQNTQFAGRVHFDKNVLREGRLRLHVSSLRPEDSGQYLCQVKTSYGVGYNKCHLNVTAARAQPKPRGSHITSRGGIALYWSLELTAAACLLPLISLLSV